MLFGLFFDFDGVVGVASVGFVHCFGSEIEVALWCTTASTHVGVGAVDDLDGRVLLLT